MSITTEQRLTAIRSISVDRAFTAGLDVDAARRVMRAAVDEYNTCFGGSGHRALRRADLEIRRELGLLRLRQYQQQIVCEGCE